MYFAKWPDEMHNVAPMKVTRLLLCRLSQFLHPSCYGHLRQATALASAKWYAASAVSENGKKCPGYEYVYIVMVV